MKGAVKVGTREIVEASVEEIERIGAHLLHSANLADEIAAFRDEIAPGLDFERELVTEFLLEALATGVPQFEILRDIDILPAFAIGSRQATAGADGRDGAADGDG